MPATISGTNGGIGLIGSGTAQNSTSGTAIDFTGIPAGVKRITVMFNGVSTNGTSVYQLQLGAGSITTTGYFGVASYGPTGNQFQSLTSGIPLLTGGLLASAANTYSGVVVISLLSSNSWVASGTGATSNVNGTAAIAGSITLSGTLDRVRITTVNGTDTFDAGSINILYE